jgi:type I pantothenate kinase
VVTPLVEAVRDRLAASHDATFVIGVAGAVAVGKSTVARDLAAALEADGRTVAVVSTDGFLLPNAELERRGLFFRKGFPESYDLDRLAQFLAEARAGRSPLAVPRYSHDRYDVEEEPDSIERPEVLVLEGVVALRADVDLGVYVDADHADVQRWYVDRFVRLVDEATDDPASFYRAWVGLSEPEVRAVAAEVWRTINLVNLVEHIEPTRAEADLVLVKGPHHEVLDSQP